MEIHYDMIQQVQERLFNGDEERPPAMVDQLV